MTAPDKAVNDQFGFSVSQSGNILAVGARISDPDGVSYAGAAYTFDISSYISSNNMPADLDVIAPLTVAENLPVGTFFGQFSAIDPDVNSVLTYHFVGGPGSMDNMLFILDANGTLRTATTFDYETNVSTYSIRVQAKDEYNATAEGNYTVTLVDDVYEDSDGDQFSDAEELSAGTDPFDPASKPIELWSGCLVSI